MGHEHSKLQKHHSHPNQTPSQPHNPALIIREIFYTSQLKKGHKRASQNLKEKELQAFMNQSSRDIIEQFDKASVILHLSKEIQALDLVMCYCDILTNNLPTINNANRDIKKIKELLPYIGSLLFGCQKLGIEVGAVLAETLCAQFSVPAFNEKTPDMLACFESTFPSEQQISEYLSQFNQRQAPEPPKNHPSNDNTPRSSSNPEQRPPPTEFLYSKSDPSYDNTLQSSLKLEQNLPASQLLHSKTVPSNDPSPQSSSKPKQKPANLRYSHCQTPRHDGDRQWMPELEESEYGKSSQMTASFPHQSESDRILAESRLYQTSRQLQGSEINQPDVAMSFGGPKLQRQVEENAQKKDDTMDTEDRNSPREHGSPEESPMKSPLAVSQSMKVNKYPNLANWSVRGLEMGGSQEGQEMSQQLIERLNSVRRNL